ncbi:MAG: hypothetical protein NHF89_00495 [Candidatus Shikimatogenerans bostrichidophilus]|nr:MAG: hypothetical protein NHF89_00495 [Candidatus Shikimatogenerans bostrichidophilus]
MKFLYTDIYNNNLKNIKNNIYILIKNLNYKYYKIYNKIINNKNKKKNIIKIINKYINKFKYNYFFQLEDKEIIKYIIYLKIKKKKEFNIYKNNNIKFLFNLYLKTKKKKNEINFLIKKTVKKWNIKRINKIDLIIIQMAICEFYFLKEKKNINIIINEYINISKIFSTYKSKYFINGILDNIFKKKIK